MSDTENNSQNEMLNLLKRIKKHIKELDTALNQKIDDIKEWIKNEKQVESKDKDEEKEKMDKIFERKGVGRPRGNHESKRLQYFEMIKSKKIKAPKEATLQYYKINYDKSSDTYVLLDLDDEQ